VAEYFSLLYSSLVVVVGLLTKANVCKVNREVADYSSMAMHTCVTSLILVERDSGNNLGSGYTGPPVDLPSYFETLFLPIPWHSSIICNAQRKCSCWVCL